jgi:tetratricopeptide (TPR) repeat protein
MGRWLEAYYAADLPVRRYLAERRADEDEEIGSLARYRATALESCLKTLPKDAPKEVRDEFVDRVKKARELLTEKFAFGDISNVNYQVAAGKLAAATTLSATDRAKATVLFQEAIELFKRVEPKDAWRKFAQVRIGECMVQMGKPAEARKHLEAFVADATNQEDWKVGPARGRQTWAWAVFWIAMSLDAENQPAKVVGTLEDFEKRFEGASVEVLVPRVRYVRILALTDPAVGRGAEGEDEVARLLKDSPDSPYVPGAAVRVAADLIKRAARARASGDTKVAGECLKRAADLYDLWVRRTPNVPPEQLTFVGQIFFDIANFDRAAELWQSALEIHRKGGNAAEVEKITISLASLLVGQKRYAEALPKFEALFIRTPEDATPLRTVFEEMKRPIANVPKEAQQERNRKLLAAVADALAKDPDGAPGVDQVRKAIPELQTEAIVRAYVDRPEHRLALARALALTLLGNDAAILPGLRAAVFDLVRRSPDLMSNLARCYEELANQDMQYPIRAVNLYNLLVDSAPDEPGVPGAKYTERWFDWKYRWTKVYLDTGRTLKQESWLRVVCAIVKGMATLGEDKRADQERAGLGKEFEALRDQADEALKALGKEGCK